MEHYRNNGQTVVIKESSAIDTGILVTHFTDSTEVTIKWNRDDQEVYYYLVTEDDWQKALALGLELDSLGAIANVVKTMAWAVRKGDENHHEATHWYRLVMAYAHRGRMIAMREREAV